MTDDLKLRKGAIKGAIKTADGTEHRIHAFAKLPIVYNNKHELVPVLLLPTLPDCVIFGMNFWNAFGVKPVCCFLEMDEQPVINEEEHPGEDKLSNIEMEQTRAMSKQILQQTVAEFPKAEGGKLGRTTMYTHWIDIGNAPPKKQRYYQMSKYVLEEVNKEINRMLELDVIEEAYFSPWNNPLVAVKKKTGKYRVCLDARHLNSIMVNEGYPIPQIAGIINNLSGCRYISSIDLKDAFWQMPLEEKSRPLTAFTVPQRGHFQFKVVPFGLCTASQA